MVSVISKAAQIKEALKSGTRAAAEKTFGKRAVSQELRRMADKLKKEKDKKIAKKAGAAGSIKKQKMTKQEKATAAFKRSEAKRKKLKEVKPKKPVKVKRVVSKEAQAKLDKEMAEELKGRTVSSRRKRIKEATDPKKRRKARKLTEGRESSEAFEARMSREARQGGGRDVGSRGAQRGSSPDPMFEYEASQASRLMRGEGDAPMTVDDRMKMIGRKKGGKVSKPRGVGCATRGYGKAMKGTK